MRLTPRLRLITFAGLTLATAWGAFGFLTVVRDVRIRTLLDATGTDEAGLVIERTAGSRVAGGADAPGPAVGDRLISLAGRPTASVFDLFDVQDLLFSPPEKLIDRVDSGTDWPRNGGRLQPIVFDGADWWVKARYVEAGSDVEREAFLLVQGVPWGGLAITLLWAVFQVSVFLLAGVSWWYRPFDPSARSFFFMTGTTLGAYVGALHWWAAANSLFVLAPFAIYAFFLPAVSVHLALTFPRLVPVALSDRRLTTGLLYVGPVVATAGFLAFLVYASWAGGEASAVGRDRFVLWVLSLSIQVFAVVAFLHYLAMVVILAFGWRQASGDMRRSAGWLLGAATATAIPIGYTVTLAWADPAEFAFGGARLPMLIAAVLFATGYVIGLGPSKLTTLEAAAGRGSKYLLASGGLAAAFVLAVGLLLFAQGRFDRAAASGGLVPAATIATLLVVAVLLWLRDRAQDAVDRRFFRDKYQLDVTLRGVNSAVVDESDPQTLTRQMLASCRNALGVDYAALYRVDDGGDDGRQFSLVAVDGEGDGGRPPVIAADGGLVRALAEGGVRRSVAASATRHPSAQRVLRAVDASVLYPLPGQSRVGGFLALGRTAKDVPLSAEDLTLLDAVTHVLAAATGLHERFEVELRRRADTIESLERQLTGLRSELAGTYAADAEPERGDADAAERVVGGGHAIRAVLASARKVADSKTTVLIRGESGTGKELLAESIHENSGRRGGPLVKVNCAALAPGVLESELFGHVKGAFTGADRDKPGRFRAAEGGTLFLDEVGDIPAETQVKLLRALQERCVEPVGSHESVDVDVRVVAATNRDLEKMIAAGTFREDLFYRLNVVTLTLPPLRERVEDLEELAIAFLHRSARESGRAVVGFGDGVLASLARYDWPGNIRELRNVVERAVVLADGSLVETADLPADFSALSGKPRRRRVRSEQVPPRPVASRPSLSPPADRPDNASPREDAGQAIGDRDQLARVLAECGGNKAAAARRLGIARSTLFSQLKKHGIG